MCGICGAFSNYLSQHELRNFENLMRVSVLRGEDGAGVVTATSKGKLNIIRTKGTSVGLMATELWEKQAYKSGQKAAVIGHARWPTKGGLELDMVHPHRAGPVGSGIVGVHNGTLTRIGDRWINPGDSDSKLLYESIFEKGLEETIKVTRGAYALSWFDERENTINFLRNEERPLSFGYYGPSNNEPSTVYFASDARFLDICLRKSETDKSELTIENIPPHRWIAFQIRQKGGGIKALWSREVKPEPEKYFDYTGKTYVNGQWIDREKGKSVVPFRAHGSALKHSRWSPRGWDDGVSDIKAAVAAVDAPADDNHHETSRGFRLSTDALAKVLNHGCTWCGNPCTMDDYKRKELSWVSYNQFLCLDCSTSVPFDASMVH